MPSYATPYAGNVRDRSRETATMVDLIRRRGDIESQGLAEQGAISARMWAGVGNTIAQGVGQYAQYKEQEPIRQAAAAKAKYETEQMADATRFKAIEKGLSQMGVDDATRVREYRAAGYGAQANAEQKRLNDVKADSIKQVGDALKVQNDQLAGIAKSFRAVQQAPPEQQAQRYYDAMVEARKSLPPEVAQHIPEVYSPENLNAVITKGEDIRDTYYYSQIAMQKATEALREQEGSRKAADAWTQSVSAGLSVTQNAEDWDGVIKMAKENGAPQSVLDYFGEYSPKNHTRAALMATTTGDEKASEFERTFVRPFAEEKAKNGGGPITAAEIRKLRREWNDDPDQQPGGAAADRTPKPTDFLPSIENRNGMERWKAEQYIKIDSDVKARKMTPQQAIEAKKTVDNAYEASLKPRAGFEGAPGFAQSVLPNSPGAAAPPPGPAQAGNPMNLRTYAPPPQGAPGGAGYGAGLPPPGARPQSAPPTAAPPPTQQRRPVVGETVYRNGVPYKVTSVDASGWSGDPIQPPRR